MPSHRPRTPRARPFLDNLGRPTFTTIGLESELWSDFYHHVIDASWTAFSGGAFLAYCVLHLLFAVLYWLAPGSLNNSDGSFADAFFFSVQTMMTIGYGGLTPNGLYANLLVSLEAFVGLFATAVLTGLVFAKFSRPMAKVLWSQSVVITRHEGKPALMLRIANMRRNRIVQASLTASASLQVTTLEGSPFRRIIDLKLVRDTTPLFSIGWTAIHIIDAQSPLLGETAGSLDEKAFELTCLLSGIDETTIQTLHSRHSYLASDVRFGEHFVDVILTNDDGSRTVDFRRFHDTVPDEG